MNVPQKVATLPIVKNQKWFVKLADYDHSDQIRRIRWDYDKKRQKGLEPST